MQRSTLVVDDDESRRRHLVHALSRRGLRYLDVADAFGAMAALGRADFGAVVATEGRRTLSLRGLCQLARRRHPDVVILVIHREGSDPAAIPGILGTDVDVIAANATPDDVAAAVESALLAPLAREIDVELLQPPGTSSESLADQTVPNARPAHLDEDPTVKTHMVQLAATPTPSTSVAPISVLAPGSLLPDEPTERIERVQPGAPKPITMPDSAPLLEGLLDGGQGPALLLGVFSQELTGRLVVKDGPAAGTLYFFRGEPVWADDPLGDAGLHRRLVHKGRINPDARIDAVAQGQLLGSLVQKGALTGQQMHDFMRELVRDFVLALSSATSGAYRFEEDRKFLDVAPLLRVNPFGLVLESRRKAVSPAQLIALSAEMEDQFVIPGPGLGKSADKLAPFVRGARLDHIIDGSKTVRQVLEYTSLDQFMGTLVMLSLKDTKLISLAGSAHKSEGGVELNDTADLSEIDVEEVTLVDAEFPTEPPQSEDEARAREQIFGLYMRLKPMTVPRQVLGVGFDADRTEIDAAFASRMKELDPKLIPEGSAQQLLTARVEELRKKVTSAHQA
ncbi:MAG TPA: DUF4388 domain-containing protein, partial [Myxococcota bacterium]